MALYTTLLARGSTPPSVFATAYTVPTTGVVVLRDVMATLFDANTTAGLYITPPAGASYWLWLKTFVASQTEHLDLRQVLPPGAIVKAYASGGSAFQYSLTGYVFQ